MSFQLTFSRRHKYEETDSGIPLNVILQFGGSEVECAAKVDPGAQFCLFRREVAEQLGIDVEAGIKQNLRTLNGSLVAYGHDVKLITLKVELDSYVCFAKDYGLPRNLLGRIGWLRRIRLAIIDYDQELYLSDYNAQD
ncbi:MAG TPA: retropepsin-like aspartic protease [Blastocatellia bacterium]|nr:retropepsin-like aspartic protease [Blastocatellia bacterium]HMV82515.1 retropepsin-like aspartic protease [Blastocatellia bacterium]HMX24671.1 retropepsin-like aspartic protease [Blastocatellia bacterium]HMY73069.1 retropepsin-like aspartic protease [Blastocatellia bacterium]HMZ18915.1 retropepsin-like aspartic protease [Blastocatellia bacterium]